MSCDSHHGNDKCPLTTVIPVVRGLLAEPTGSPDSPYAPVVLESLTGPEAVEFASSPENARARDYPAGLTKGPNPPLFAELLGEGGEEAIRGRLREAVTAYVQEFGGKPQTVCIRGQGILHVAAQGDAADGPLANRVALVTGAAGAIGYGICVGLLENGCHLAASDLPGAKLDEFVADLKQTAGDRVIGVGLDVTDNDAVAAGFDQVVRTWGGIDIVVVNAGIAMASDIKDMDLERFRQLEKVNIEGTLLTLKAAHRLFSLQGTGGDIVIISTKNVPSPGAGFGGYSATKAACHQLGRIASLEFAELGVRVNMVAPDAVFAEGKYKSGLWAEVGPDRMRARGLDEEGLKDYYRQRNLLKMSVTARHVANAVLFFATRQTPTTGATIPVDGGLPDATPR